MFPHSAFPHRLIRLTAAAAIATSLPLAGCVVANTAVGVAGTTVKTGVHVAGAVGGAAVKTTGAAVHAAAGGDQKSSGN